MWEDLPEFLWVRIFVLLDFKSILAAKRVSRTWWRTITDNDSLWGEKFETDFAKTHTHDVRFEKEYGLEWKLRFGQPTVTELKGHRYARLVVRLKCLGSQLVTSSADRTVRLWNLDSKACVHVFNVSELVLAVDLDEKHIIGGTLWGYIYAWQRHTFPNQHIWKAHNSRVADVHLNGNTLISGDRHAELKFWDVLKRECLRRINVDRLLCFHVLGEEIVCGTSTGLVPVFHRSGELLYTLEGLAENATAVSASSSHIAVGFERSGVAVWDKRTRTRVAHLSSLGSRVHNVHCDSSKVIWMACKDRMQIWDVKSWKCARRFENRHMRSFHYDRGRIVVGLRIGFVQVYDFNH